MNISEIRVGNWVSYKGKTVVLTVEDFAELAHDNYFDIMEPVPLTQEIMVKYWFYYRPCGISGADMWQGIGFWQPVKERNSDFVLRGNREGKLLLRLSGFFNSEIRYEHQLQNLYQDIYGKELESR